MPYTMNGIGTWHYGKRNLQRRHGVCESCGKQGALESYDTTLYFVFFFIPLLPLGKYHLVDHCPACTRHRSMRLSQWQRVRQEALDETERLLRENPRDPETARKALGACAAFQEQELLTRVAPVVRQNFRDNAGVQLLLGQVYGHFDMLREAEEALRESIRIDDKPEVRESLAMNLIRQGRPSDAATYLYHINSPAMASKSGYLLTLAEGYQAVGNHSNSLHVLTQAAQTFPDLQSDKTYKRLLKTAKKNQYSSKPIKSDLLQVAGAGASKQGGDFSGILARIVSVVLLLGIAGGYVYWADYSGKHRTVHVVNGLLKPYRVRINDQVVRLPSLQPMRAEIAEGTVQVEVEDPSLGIPKETLQISTPFWSRPFSRKVFVLNPDRTAPLLWEKTWYAAKATSLGKREREARAYIGQSFYRFDSVNHLFDIFPQTIRVQGGGTVSRTRIGLVREQRQEDLFTDLMELDVPQAQKLAEARSLVVPDNETYVNFLAMVMKPDELKVLAKTKLTMRPVLKPWHVAYQDGSTSTDTVVRAALAKEYADMLAADSTNTLLMYLAGRVAMDPAEARRLMEGAVSGQPPVGEAALQLSQILMANGDFQQALVHARSAARLLPNDHAARWQFTTALEATGDLKGALQEMEKGRREPRGMMFGGFAEACLTARIESTTRAMELLRQQMESRRGATLKEVAKRLSVSIEKNYEAQLAYRTGDVALYLELTEAAGRAAHNFDYAMTRGDLTSASAILESWVGGEDEDEDEDAMDPDSALLVYVAHKRAGNETSASRALELALKALDDAGGMPQATLLKELRKDRDDDTSAVLELTVDPNTKTVWLTAAGTKFPANRERYFALARRLNFQTGFPHLFLNEVLGK